MDYLLNEGFSKDLIIKLESKYDESVIELIKLERENIKEIIKYFRRIGIKKIDELLLAYPELFFKDVKIIISTFKKYVISDLVKKINEDTSYIERM